MTRTGHPAHPVPYEARSRARRRPAVSSGEALVTLRAMLLEQREFRIDQLVALHTAARPAGAAAADSTAAVDAEITRSLDAGARAALRDVAAALWRMDAGCYGRCVTCDGPVGMERLEILPQAARCMPCHRAAQATE